MKKVLSALLILALCGLAMGQATPPSYTVKDGLAEWIAPEGTTMDTLWPAAIKILMAMGYRVVTADKASGILEVRVATLDQFLSSLTGKLTDADMGAASVLFDSGEKEIMLVAMWKSGIGGSATAKKFYREFFKRLTAAIGGQSKE